MELLNDNYVINLEKRKDRLQHVKNEFKKLNIPLNRFNAIKHEKGYIGCTLSHIKCLELAIERGLKYIFICEDDITFTKPEVFKKALCTFNKKVKDWDVLLISGFVKKPYEKTSSYCLKVRNCQTATGYVVKKHYYETLLENFKNGLKGLKEDKPQETYAIDQYWKQLQRTGNWYILYPLTVIQYPNFSDINNRVRDYSSWMLNC